MTPIFPLGRAVPLFFRCRSYSQTIEMKPSNRTLSIAALNHLSKTWLVTVTPKFGRVIIVINYFTTFSSTTDGLCTSHFEMLTAFIHSMSVYQSDGARKLIPREWSKRVETILHGELTGLVRGCLLELQFNEAYKYQAYIVWLQWLQY